MDSDLLELSRGVASGDYHAALRAVELIKKRNEDPKVAEDAEAIRKVALLQVRVNRIRAEAFDQALLILRGAADRIAEVRSNPVQIEDWIDDGKALDETWKKIQCAWDYLRQSRLKICRSCSGTLVGKDWSGKTSTCSQCYSSAVPGTTT